MRVLLTNDDGVSAEGLLSLFSALSVEHTVRVVAPLDERSGSSGCLTIGRSLRLEPFAPGVFAVDGTPADAARIGVAHAFDSGPDIVVSGINHGHNLGERVLYSGTIAAAREGRYLPYPALALSLAGSRPRHWSTAARFARAWLEVVPRGVGQLVFSVNVPDAPWSALRGVCFTRLGDQRPVASVQVVEPGVYRHGPGDDGVAPEPGTDRRAVDSGWISVTPLSATPCVGTIVRARAAEWAHALHRLRAVVESPSFMARGAAEQGSVPVDEGPRPDR